MKNITSTQNTFVKQLVLLKEKSRERKKSGVLIIEGLREIKLAINGGYKIKTILFYNDIILEEDIYKLISKYNIDVDVIEISKEVYHKVAYRETTEGILAVVYAKEHSLESLNFKRVNPLILVAEAPEKPGNIGALLRTADAANLDAVIIANPKTDIYNPNIIRSSVGCVFTNNIAIASTQEIISFLKNNNIKINCAALTASIDYHKVNYNEATAIVVGTEATGLSDEWLNNSTQNIIIPMQGEIDSMNVSVSAGIIIFEAKRQRSFN